jgi:hypothetical protein
MVRFHQRLGDIVQQTSEHDVFRQPGSQRLIRALKNVGRRSESKLKEIEQVWLSGHRRQAGHVHRLARQTIAERVGAAGREQSSYAPAQRTLIDLLIELANSHRRGRPTEPQEHGIVQLIGQVHLQGFGFRFGVHALHGKGPAQGRDYFRLVDGHGSKFSPSN